MFVKRCARVYKGKVYESFWLVSAYRKGNTIKHKYIANIDNLSPLMRSNLNKVLQNSSSIVLEDLSEFFIRGYDYGEIVFFLYIMHKLGIINLLKEKLSKRALSLIAAVLLNRVLKPCSKPETVEWIKHTSFPFFTELSPEEYSANNVYSAMDEVYENREKIMDGFYKLGGEVPVFLLYDITSIYFEGEGIKIAKRGYSRDHRGDRPQVLLGVALNEKGFPVYFDIFSGNATAL